MNKIHGTHEAMSQTSAMTQNSLTHSFWKGPQFISWAEARLFQLAVQGLGCVDVPSLSLAAKSSLAADSSLPMPSLL